MSQRQAVTRQVATRYRAASKGRKALILDELCATTGWHRDHARKALRTALGPRPVKPVQRRPRSPVYDEAVLEVLRKVWAVMDAPAGKRMAPFLPEIITRLRACGELDIDDEVAAKVSAVSAATIDRRLASERKRLEIKGRSGTKPGTLLKAQIPIRTWADWNEETPGFVEIDCVGHEGGDPSGDFCQTLTVTDIRTGWTETRAVKNKAQKWVFEALMGIREVFPFPILGIDSDNGSEFINSHLFHWCVANEVTFTRSRARHSNDGAHVEQKNWSVVRHAVGYHRYDTTTELDLLNELYALLRLQTNFFSPSQKLVEKHRVGAKVTKRYDTAATPYQRVMAEEAVTSKAKQTLTRQYHSLNPAQIRRDIIALQDQLLAITRSKHEPARLPVKPPATTRAKIGEATNHRSRAS